MAFLSRRSTRRDVSLILFFPARRRALAERRHRAQAEFEALSASWAAESSGRVVPAPQGTLLAKYQQLVIDRHRELLDRHQEDLDRFRFNVPIKLAKHESDYSWEFRAKRDEEIDRLLAGILSGLTKTDDSIEFLARCHDALPIAFSSTYLRLQLERAFTEARRAPRPSFQLTLDYARHLSGRDFEEWVARLLRENGVPDVRCTPASHDQGADVIVQIGNQKIVVQAKQYSEPVGNSAVQEAHSAKGYYHATDAWVVTTSVFTRDAIDLACQLGVRLVPGAQLSNLPRMLLAQSPRMQVAEIESGLTGSGMGPAGGPAALPGVDGGHLSPSVHALTLEPARSNKIQSRRHWIVLAACVLIPALFIGYRTVHRDVKTESEHAVQKLLSTYQDAIRTKNLALVETCYAPVVDNYYLSHGASRERVLKEIGRAFEMYNSVAKLSFANIAFRDVTASSALATFDKEWEFRGARAFAGSERQEMKFVKQAGRWRISSERELQVYWVRHPR